MAWRFLNFKRKAIGEAVREDIEKTFYKNRFMYFYGDILSRWLLLKKQAELEVTASYRANYYSSRSFSTDGPYPYSLFKDDYQSSVLNGLLSVFELGLSLDNRGEEASPSSGYWLELSARGASKIIGSAWEYVGGHWAGRVYFPLLGSKTLVLASPSVIDAISGDAPFDALLKIGGSQYSLRHSAFGGQNIGRGIREQCYVGRFKILEQLELRYNFWTFKLWSQEIGFTGALFGDLGLTAWDYNDMLTDLKQIKYGFGAGLRMSLNRNFIVRADLGLSPSENFAPKFYLVVGNIF